VFSGFATLLALASRMQPAPPSVAWLGADLAGLNLNHSSWAIIGGLLTAAAAALHAVSGRSLLVGPQQVSKGLGA